jgi:nucleotide-binding universal stress UspA family protein
MPIRILALVPEAVSARGCLDVASAAALAVDADIEVFHVKVDPDKLRNGDEEAAIQHMRASREGTAEERAEAVRATFELWRAGLSPQIADRTTWREAVGAEERNVAEETRHFDLIVLPRAHNLDGGDAHHAAFRRSHRPLLYVPDSAGPIDPQTFARHMAIAWKPTSQARRAVEGAAAWLRQADQVTAIMVAADLQQGGWEELERLSHQLGVDVSPLLITPNDRPLNEQLLTAIHEVAADTAVLGAYQHTDVIEWVLPSTTRFILAHAELPLFLAH